MLRVDSCIPLLFPLTVSIFIVLATFSRLLVALRLRPDAFGCTAYADLLVQSVGSSFQKLSFEYIECSDRF